MAVISITLNDQQIAKLQETAHRLGVTIEDLVLFSIDDLLSQPDEAFLRTVDSVIHKNAELYRRLT
jgi:antitoxin FitA